MVSEENVEVVRRVYEAAERNDLDTAYFLLHPEIEFHTYTESPEAGVYRGRDEVRRYNEELFAQFESIRFEIVNAKPQGNLTEFTSEVFINDEPMALGSGHSKKRAEQAAAEKAMKMLDIS